MVMPAVNETLLVTCLGTPSTITVVVVVLEPAGGETGGRVAVPGGGGGGAIGIRFNMARRIGLPVSAATTRPRMTAVPVGSGRRTTSRGGWPASAGRGSAGGG
jgi:hypothetical protein